MRFCRSRFKLWVELDCDVVGVVGDLDDLNQALVWGCSGDDKAARLKRLTVEWIELVPVAVALPDLVFSVERCGAATGLEFTCPGPEPHRAPLLGDRLLILEQADDRVWCVLRELVAIGAFEAADIACELDAGHLHA